MCLNLLCKVSIFEISFISSFSPWLFEEGREKMLGKASDKLMNSEKQVDTRSAYCALFYTLKDYVIKGTVAC